MGKKKIQVIQYNCERCRHVWSPRNKVRNKPIICPKCKSPYWDIKRKLSLTN